MTTPETMPTTAAPARHDPFPQGRSGSKVASFLSGKTLLVTGTTGFLAKAIVEKILFEAPDIRRLYLLVRPRRRGAGVGRAQSAAARVDKEVIDSPAMVRLRTLHGERYADFMRERVQAVSGDLSVPDLGLGAEDRARLAEEVDVVINSAATVVFDERIDQALALNTLGPHRLLAFAKTLRRRPVFVQISTCYVCGNRTGLVPEEVIERPAGPGSPRPPEDLEREIASIQEEIAAILAESGSEASAIAHRGRAARGLARVPTQAEVEAAKEDHLRETLVEAGMRRARGRGWHDTYTYTKAMGERLILRDRGDLPVVILRPSIIESSLREPVPGWIDGYRMADPLIAAYGRGRLEFFPTRPEVGLDIIPLDLVVNAILASIPRAAAERGAAVYQVASTSRNLLTLRKMVGLLTQHFKALPMHDAAGRPIAVKRFGFASPFQFRIRCFLSYELPLMLLSLATAPLSFLDSVARFRRALAGKKAAVAQLLYFSDIYGPYTCLDCRFATENTRRLFESLGGEDQGRFAFDETRIDWAEYIDGVHIPGLRRNVLQAEARSAGEWAGMERVIEKVHPHEAAVAEEGAEPIPPPAAAGEPAAPAPAPDPQIRTLRDLLSRSAGRFPERVALQVERDGKWERLTYRELLRQADELGARFHAAGIRPADRVILWSESRPEWGLAYLALSGIGAVMIPADPQLTEEDVESLASVTRARAFVASDRCLARLSPQGRARLAGAAAIARIDAAFAGEGGAPLPPPSAPDAIDRTADASNGLASIIFTSGTTVAPKGVMLTHANLLANARAVTAVASVSESDAFLSVLPLFHVFEFTNGFLVPLSTGASVTYLAELSSSAIVGTMRATRTTVMLGVPRLYSLLGDGIRTRAEEAGPIGRLVWSVLTWLSRRGLAMTGGLGVSRALFGKVHAAFGGRVRLFVSGGAALDPKVYRAFREMGFEILEGYGLTETAPVLTLNPPGRSRPGSVGKAIPGVRVWISRPDAKGVGEIVASGPNVMPGYWERAEESERVFSNGWFRTGDLGYFDADGYLYLTGRIKDLIITAAGKNVYPDEVEAHYRGIPGVKEFTIIGVRPPGALGEEVHAVVVPDADPAAGAAGEGAILARIQEAFTARAAHLPSYQHVQAVHVWQGDLPKTSTLKVKRARVKAQIDAGLAHRDADPHAKGGAPAHHGGHARGTEKIVAFLSRVTGTPESEITPAKGLELDLGVDSLMRVEIAAFLESHFQASLSDEEQLALKTVSDVIEASRKGGRGRRATESAQAEIESTETIAYWERQLATANWGQEGPADGRPSRFHALARALILGAGRLLYGALFRLSAEGRERLPADRSCIIAANHASHLDSLAVILAAGPRGRRLRAVGAKDYFFRNRFSAWFFGRLLHAIPFDRHENFLEGLRLCRRALLAGDSLLIFPEGTRTPTGDLQPFRLGVGVLARELKVPIVPAYIEGAFESLPKGRALPRPGKIRVHFGEPILPDAAGAGDGAANYEAYKKIVEATRDAISAMRRGRP